MTDQERAAMQQALEALEIGWSTTHTGKDARELGMKAITSLKAALAQQAEPDHETRAELAEQQVVQLAEERDHYRNLWQKARQAEPVASLNAWAEARLARHGIQACLYPNCVGGQSGTVCHKHCPVPCPDCRGIGYDASGQLCACQQNPSF